MSRRVFFRALAAILTILPGWCQETLPKPLPLRMSSPAAWKITYAYPDESRAESVSRFARYFPKTIEVEKSGNTVHEKITYRSGEKQERWIVADREALRAPGNDAVVAVSFGEDPPPGHYTFKDADFQDLGWLGPNTLRGSGTYLGRKVIVFVEPNRRLKSSEPFNPDKVPSLPVEFGKTRDRIAALDPNTLQPLYFFDGGCARVYEYPSPPAKPLAPPAEFVRILSETASKK